MEITIPMANTVANQIRNNLGIGEDPIVRNQWFNNQEVTLDGWHFVSCRFDNCKIRICSAKFKMENCFIDEKTLVVINDEASNIVRMFHLRNKYMAENYPFYAPQHNEDGTFSVGVNE